jgi:hypothetical protein
MNKSDRRSNRSALSVIREQYEKDRLLLERRSQLEEQSATARRKHERWTLLVDRGLLALVVGLSLGGATLCGNILVERYKSSAASEQARAQTIKTASNEVWKKLEVFQESVAKLDTALQRQSFEKSINAFVADRPKAARAVDESVATTGLALSDVWKALQNEELNLGPYMYLAFYNAIVEEAAIRYIYVSEAQKGSPREADEAVVSDTEAKFESQRSALLNAVNQL